MRTFSYVLAAFVITALAFGAVARLVSRPLDRIVRQWIGALPLCAMVVVTDREGVIFQQVLGGTEAAALAADHAHSRIEITSIMRGFTVVAIAVVAGGGARPVWYPWRSGHRRGRFAAGEVSATVRVPPRA